MTNAVHGKSGVVSIGGTISEVTQWSMSRVTDASEATSFTSAGNREYVAGLFGWTGSFTTLVFANKTGLQSAATFQVGATAAANAPVFTGSIIITDEPVAVDVNGVVQYAYTFTGTGTCTAATS